VQGAEYLLTFQLTLTKTGFGVSAEIIYREDALVRMAKENLTVIDFDTQGFPLGSWCVAATS